MTYVATSGTGVLALVPGWFRGVLAGFCRVPAVIPGDTVLYADIARTGRPDRSVARAHALMAATCSCVVPGVLFLVMRDGFAGALSVVIPF